ncbi:MAG: ATP-binding cassette domain-containing protein [Chloroflexota bacterium]
MPERNTDPVAREEPVKDRPLLALREIGMTYPGRDHGEPLRVFESIDLAVEKGDLVVAAGRSGSGKTTLLHIAAGLVRPTTGEVRWSDVALAELDDDRLARIRGRSIGIVFQNAALIETLTAAENVALQAIPGGVRDGRERALELLARQGLFGRARHYPSHLSGGEQQRVALARALFADPPLLIVDEPTANLDRRSAEAVTRQLRQLADDGHGLLVASHDAHVISIATRVLDLEPETAR